MLILCVILIHLPCAFSFGKLVGSVFLELACHCTLIVHVLALLRQGMLAPRTRFRSNHSTFQQLLVISVPTPEECHIPSAVECAEACRMLHLMNADGQTCRI